MIYTIVNAFDPKNADTFTYDTEWNSWDEVEDWFFGDCWVHPDSPDLSDLRTMLQTLDRSGDPNPDHWWDRPAVWTFPESDALGW